MDEKDREQEIRKIRQDFSLLSTVFENGKKDKPMWFHNLLLLAWRAARINLTKDVLNIIAAVDRNYYTDVMPGQMAENQLFAVSVLDLCQYLVDNKVVSPAVEPDIKPTQATARA